MIAVYVAIAGAAGVLCRYGIGESISDDSRLWATLAVNIAGSLALGLLVGAGASDDARTIAGVGFLGGFTTFSTFSVEAFRELEEGRPGRFAIYVGVSVGFGIAAAAAG